MRLETFPLILGAFVGLVGLLLIIDALTTDTMVREERRRRPRRERDRWGEALVGLGAVAMAAAFVGRDTWRYSTVAVIAGTVLLLWGVMRNGTYIRGVIGRNERPKTGYAEGSRRIR
ncbi:MAG TPA: hypothetical protein VFT29_02600 [Gemmatimonadaceae bacterium]|nr:hypothetical protein [Gemmatimonadaceae bacterium]